MTKVKICPKCNEEYEGRKKLCPNCGHVFNEKDIIVKNEEPKDIFKSKKEKKAFNIEKALYIIIGTSSFALDVPIILVLIIIIPIVLFTNAVSGASKSANLDFLSFSLLKIICLFIIISNADNTKSLRITGIIMLLIIIIEIVLLHKYLPFIY